MGFDLILFVDLRKNKVENTPLRTDSAHLYSDKKTSKFAIARLSKLINGATPIRLSRYYRISWYVTTVLRKRLVANYWSSQRDQRRTSKIQLR